MTPFIIENYGILCYNANNCTGFLSSGFTGKEPCLKASINEKTGYTAQDTTVMENCFASLPEAKHRLADMQYTDRHGAANLPRQAINTTVDNWFP